MDLRALFSMEPFPVEPLEDWDAEEGMGLPRDHLEERRGRPDEPEVANHPPSASKSSCAAVACLAALMADLGVSAPVLVEPPKGLLAPPVVCPADVFGAEVEESWDPVGDAEFLAAVARNLAEELLRGKRKRRALMSRYEACNRFDISDSEDSEEEAGPVDRGRRRVEVERPTPLENSRDNGRRIRRRISCKR